MNSDFNGLFTFKEAEDAYKKLKKKCKTDSECPDQLICTNEKCKFKFDCRVNDLTQCGSKNYTDSQQLLGCKSGNDCFSNSCENGKCTGKSFHCEIGNGIAKYGFDNNEKCTKNEECLSDNCEKNICKNPNNDGFVTPDIVLSCIIIVFIIFLFLWYGCLKIKRRLSKK